MKGPSKTKRELLAVLEQKVKEFERSEELRKRTGETLWESEQRFHNLVEATSDWIWEINSDGYYTYVSPKIKDLLGYEPEDVLGKTPFDLMPENEIKRVGALFKDIEKSRQPFRGLTNVNVHKSGREVVLETNGVPIIDAWGNFLGYRGFDRDITERKMTEEALRTSQLRLSEAMSLASIVYWEDDPEKNLLLLNDPFYTFHGTNAEKEGGYRMAKEEYAKRFIHPDDLPLFSQLVKKNAECRDTESVSDFEHRIIRRDGKVRYVFTRVRIIRDGSKHPARVYGTDQDITDRKLAEEEREKLILKLREALSQVKALSGLLPICSSCNKIRNKQGHWEQMETYIRDRSEADFSHSICPECAEMLYPEIMKENNE